MFHFFRLRNIRVGKQINTFWFIVVAQLAFLRSVKKTKHRPEIVLIRMVPVRIVGTLDSCNPIKTINNNFYYLFVEQTNTLILTTSLHSGHFRYQLSTKIVNSIDKETFSERHFSLYRTYLFTSKYCRLFWTTNQVRCGYDLLLLASESQQIYYKLFLD